VAPPPAPYLTECAAAALSGRSRVAAGPLAIPAAAGFSKMADECLVREAALSDLREIDPPLPATGDSPDLARGTRSDSAGPAATRQSARPTTLDGQLAGERVALIKVDVEGLRARGLPGRRTHVWARSRPTLLFRVRSETSDSGNIAAGRLRVSGGGGGYSRAGYHVTGRRTPSRGGGGFFSCIPDEAAMHQRRGSPAASGRSRATCNNFSVPADAEI
jgi:hypothetical protein